VGSKKVLKKENEVLTQILVQQKNFSHPCESGVKTDQKAT